MKKIFAAFALAAGLAVGMTGGAQAQTTGNLNGAGGSYTIMVTESNAASIPNTGAYTYTYTAHLSSITGVKDVGNFSIGGIQGYIPGFAGSTGAFAGAVVGEPAPVGGLETLSFASISGGLTGAQPDASFSFDSTLPPNGKVSLTSNGDSPTGQAGAVLTLDGPGPAAIPEAGSFALFGLGLLPLALIARRRLARNV